MAIGVQGLRAAETRAYARAVNIANMLTEDYRPLRPQQVSTGAGVSVSVRQAPQIEAVDLAGDMTDMRIASHAYRAAAAVIRTGDEMHRTLIDAVA